MISQKPEFGKNFFLRDLGRLNVCTKSIKNYLEKYFGFGSEEVNINECSLGFG